MNRLKLFSIFLLLKLFAQYSPVMARIQMKAYGSLVSTAYYYSDIFVGLPTPQRQSVILDTGSNLLAFSSTQCQQCGTHLDAYYDPLKSTTMREIPCHSYCKVCVNKRKQCAYTIHYLEGSSLSGSYYQDFVALRNEKGDSLEPAPVVVGLATIFGGITRETNLFYTQAASGILGLAYTASSQERAPLFQTWSKRSKYVKDAVLSMCFSSEGGMISFGGYNSEYWVNSNNDKSFRSTSETGFFARLLGFSYISGRNTQQNRSSNKNKIQWTPLSILNGNYYVNLIKGSVHQTQIMFPTDSSGNVKPIPLVIDSGTTLTYFPEQIFIQIINIINRRISETESKSTFRSLIDAGSKALEFVGIKSPSEELGIKEISIFPGEIPGTALLRKRIYRKLTSIDNVLSTTNGSLLFDDLTFNSTVHPESFDLKNNVFNNTDDLKGSFDIDESVSRILLETSKGERCWKLRDQSEMSRFPVITLGFPELKIDWEPSQYLYKKYRNTYCLGFDSDKSFLVLGASFFINKDVILDVKNSRVSFVKSNCPQIAHARRTSAFEMTQLLKDTSTSSVESIMKSEVVVFDSNSGHAINHSIDKSQSSYGRFDEYKYPYLSSNKTNSNRLSTDNETMPESQWDPKNLTSPSSLSSSLYPFVAQFTGATNLSVEGIEPYEEDKNQLVLYLKQQLQENKDNKNLEEQDSNSEDEKTNSSSTSDSINFQPAYIHWFIILTTALISCSVFNIINIKKNDSN